jgi:hypothetical protein
MARAGLRPARHGTVQTVPTLGRHDTARHVPCRAGTCRCRHLHSPAQDPTENFEKYENRYWQKLETANFILGNHQNVKVYKIKGNEKLKKFHQCGENDDDEIDGDDEDLYNVEEMMARILVAGQNDGMAEMQQLIRDDPFKFRQILIEYDEQSKKSKQAREHPAEKLKELKEGWP